MHWLVWPPAALALNTAVAQTLQGTAHSTQESLPRGLQYISGGVNMAFWVTLGWE